MFWSKECGGKQEFRSQKSVFLHERREHKWWPVLTYQIVIFYFRRTFSIRCGLIHLMNNVTLPDWLRRLILWCICLAWFQLLGRHDWIGNATWSIGWLLIIDLVNYLICLDSGGWVIGDTWFGDLFWLIGCSSLIDLRISLLRRWNWLFHLCPTLFVDAPPPIQPPTQCTWNALPPPIIAMQ